MPTQGWVRFDPTPRQDGANPATIDDLPFPIDLYLDIPQPTAPPASVPEAAPLLPSPELGPQDIFLGTGSATDDEAGPGLSIPSWAVWVVAGAAALFGLVPGVKWARRRRRMRKLATGDIASAWRDIIDRLDDLGLHAQATATPREVAVEVSEHMVPLADAYGNRLYGDPTRPATGAVDTATTSLAATREALALRFSRSRRLQAHYRVGSIIPRWARRLLRRA